MLKTDKKNLINTATWLEPPEDIDPVFGEGIGIAHALADIRISESTNAITYSSDGETRSANIVLFYFISSSTVDGVSEIPGWKRGHKIEFGGSGYVIKGIRQCYDGHQLHHLEVTLE